MNKSTAQVPLCWLESVVALVIEQGKLLQEKDRQLEKQDLLLQEQSEQIAALKISLQELRDEVARVKKLPKRPKFRPPGGEPRARSGLPAGVVGSSVNQLTPARVHEEIKVAAVGVPEGSRFKGYQDYGVQELSIVVKDIIYRLEVWQAPDGRVIRAALPEHLIGTHFGSELRGLVHNLYAACMTEPEIFSLLTGFGVAISTGQIHNILMSEVEKYCDVSRGILEAGLETAPHIWTDDTGAKHKHKHGYCTHVGGQYFAFFKTSVSKSRANFLEILLQGKEGYCINEAFIHHISDNSTNCKEQVYSKLKLYLGRQYETLEEMNGVLDAVDIKNKALRLQCIEAGLVGFISQALIRPNQILLSDRAGQFAILDHAACWVHMERPLRTVVASTSELEKIIKHLRDMIWDLYAKVKIASVTPRGECNAKGVVRDRQIGEINQLYDELIAVKTNSLCVRAVIESFSKYRHELLKALDHPGLPLHNNASERDIRGVVKRRNVSGSTKSDEGKKYRDALTTIKQTCLRLGISFFGYMKQWFTGQQVDLALIIRRKYLDTLEDGAIQLSG